MKVYIAFDQHRVVGVYTTFREAEKQGRVEVFDLDIKLCSCGVPLTLNAVSPLILPGIKPAPGVRSILPRRESVRVGLSPSYMFNKTSDGLASYMM